MMNIYGDLAKSTGMSKQNLQGIAHGKWNASYPTAKALAEETKTDIELWVRGGNGTTADRKAAILLWVANEIKAGRIK